MSPSKFLSFTEKIFSTISLFPQEIQDDLEVLFGNEYKKLDKDERLALILAYVDKEVTNSRLSNIGAIHSADSSKILRKLVDKSLLISDGIGRGMKYFINDNFKIAGIKPADTGGKVAEQELIILNYLKEHKKITTAKVKELLNIKDSRAKEILKSMTDNLIIQKLGSGRNTYYGVIND
jgi:ATP-dependent DNA helicase RecG